MFGDQWSEPGRSSDKQLLLDRSKALKGSKEMVLINQPTAERWQWSGPQLSATGSPGVGTRVGMNRVIRSFQGSRLETSSAGDPPPKTRFSKSGCSCRPGFIWPFLQKMLAHVGTAVTQTPTGGHPHFVQVQINGNQPFS